MTINPHIYPNPGYDPLTDMVPITRLGVGPQTLVVHKGVPAHSVEQADEPSPRARRGRTHFHDTPGIGTLGHHGLEPAAASAPTSRATHVPYKGVGQVDTVDLVAGHRDLDH